MICKFKKRVVIKQERLSTFTGPREGASREEKTEDTGEAGFTKRTTSHRGWGTGIKTRRGSASQKGKGTETCASRTKKLLG